jgi:hypothetical protein
LDGRAAQRTLNAETFGLNALRHHYWRRQQYPPNTQYTINLNKANNNNYRGGDAAMVRVFGVFYKQTISRIYCSNMSAIMAIICIMHRSSIMAIALMVVHI